MTTLDYLLHGAQHDWERAMDAMHGAIAEQQQDIAHIEAGMEECQRVQLMQSQERAIRGLDF